MRLQVVATPFVHEAPLHGLLTSVPELDLDERWEGGVTIQSEGCADVSSWTSDCAVWPGDVKPDFAEPGVLGDWVNMIAYEIYTEFTCSTSGGPAVVGSGTRMEELFEIAKRQLDVGSGKALEAEFWSGTQASLYGVDEAQALTKVSGSTPVIAGSENALDYRTGLAAAGQALANCSIGAPA